MKVCSKCGKELPATKEYFYVTKANKDGLSGVCKPCILQQRKQYQQECKESIAKRKKNYYKSSREVISQRRKQYYKANKEIIINHVKQYVDANKAKVQETRKQYRENNKELIAERGRQYRKNNKEAINKRQRSWYNSNKKLITEYRNINKEHIAEVSRQWRQNNKDKVCVRSQLRKARKKALPATLTASQWAETKAYFNDRCAYCGKKLKLTQDHFEPLSKAGAYTQNNIIPACTVCNSSKNDRDFMEWYPTYKYFSEERADTIINYINAMNER